MEMNKEIQDMMEEAGIGHNVVQVFDDPDGGIELLYPNHMINERFDDLTIEQALIVIEKMVVDHIEECKNDLNLLRDYGSSL